MWFMVMKQMKERPWYSMEEPIWTGWLGRPGASSLGYFRMKDQADR